MHVLQGNALGFHDPLPDEDERQPAAANPSAAARMRLGNISPSSTHTTGPHDMPNAITNTLAAIRAMGPVAPSRNGLPSAPRLAVPKMIAMVARDTATSTTR